MRTRKSKPHYPSTPKPRIVLPDGSDFDVTKHKFVAGLSQSDPLPEPPTELEELRDKVDFYKRHLKRVNNTLDNVLNIYATQDTGYIDAILGLAQAQGLAKPEKPKQKGRKKLSRDEAKKRMEIVEKAKKMKKENPLMYWKEIATGLDIPEKTLRDWRHRY
jgi:hypothetical protein